MESGCRHGRRGVGGLSSARMQVRVSGVRAEGDAGAVAPQSGCSGPVSGGGVVSNRGSPVGTVTFLFTDVEVSTRRWETDPDAMRVELAVHDDVLRAAVEVHEGWLSKHTGARLPAARLPGAGDRCPRSCPVVVIVPPPIYITMRRRWR